MRAHRQAQGIVRVENHKLATILGDDAFHPCHFFAAVDAVQSQMVVQHVENSPHVEAIDHHAGPDQAAARHFEDACLDIRVQHEIAGGMPTCVIAVTPRPIVDEGSLRGRQRNPLPRGGKDVGDHPAGRALADAAGDGNGRYARRRRAGYQHIEDRTDHVPLRRVVDPVRTQTRIRVDLDDAAPDVAP
jgi:hypothetical protein